MNDTVYNDLRAMRDGLTRLREGTVAAEAGLSLQRLREIERGGEPSVYELEQLAAVYGVDVESLFDEPIRLPHGDGVNLLASLDEFRDLDDVRRVRVLRAASAARELVQVRRRLGEAAIDLPRLPVPDPALSPYRQGAELAQALRRELNLGVGAIPSARDFVQDRLPSVSVLYADLTREGAAGLGFADAHRGPSVVLNTRGKNEHPAVRRFSLCHELCHLLADWNRTDPLATISGFLSDAALGREQRANGFAIRLLCPESVVRDLSPYRDEDAARVLMTQYGLHYQAARLTLLKDADIHLPPRLPRALEALAEPDAAMGRQEAPRGHENFPVDGVPAERRGVLAQTVMRAWAAGVVTRDAAARFLAVTPDTPIERVADYFAVDLPAEAATG
jgi:Zn-dependent peptidase ImmA (M78 family)